MRNNYVAPQIEVVEIEIEDAILAASGVESFNEGSGTGDTILD